MVDIIVKFFSNIKVIMITLGIIGSSSVYSYNYLHKNYLKKSGLVVILDKHSTLLAIGRNIDEITELRINQGYAKTEAEQYKFEILVKVKESRILGLKASLIK